MTAYQSISVGEDEESAQNQRDSKQNNKRDNIKIMSLVVVLLIMLSPLLALPLQSDSKEKALTTKIHHRHINVPMPAGVNLGSWVR